MTAAVILVSMCSTPTNGFAPTARVGVLSALQRMVIVLRMAGADRVVVAADAEVEALEQHLAHLGVVCLGPAAPAVEASAEVLARAAGYLAGKCSRVLLAPAEAALFHTDTAKRLLEQPLPHVRPVYQGDGGWPLTLPGALLAQEGGARSAADLLNRLAAGAGALVVEDEGVVLRLDEAAGWQELLERHRIDAFRPVSKLTVAREETFMGPGSRQLLTAIDETGSVREACGRMGLSYSKGWRIINGIERQVGFQVVTRYKGGQHGGRSALSPMGRALLERYNAYAAECTAAIEAIFERYWGKADWMGGPEDA